MGHKSLSGHVVAVVASSRHFSGFVMNAALHKELAPMVAAVNACLGLGRGRVRDRVMVMG